MSDKDATELLRGEGPAIARAAQMLRLGEIVAVPTETVYGLAARADSPEAVAKIYAAKGRPEFNPLIVHVANLDQAQSLAHFNRAALALAKSQWPGPLTLVLPLKTSAQLAKAVTAGLPTVALRMPAHPIMQQLLAACEFPLAAPSANRSGFISPTSADHVLASLDGRVPLVIDGGQCQEGLESTIVAIEDEGKWRELRPGPLDLAKILGESPQNKAGAAAGSVEAPGQLASHYSPGKPMRLNAGRAKPDEFMIGFGTVAGDVTLSKSGNFVEAGAFLYESLHQAAKSPKPKIAVASIPDHGIGRAINDRLRRAATPVD